MRHLSPEQLVDLAEGVEEGRSALHVRSCGACRRQLTDLREAMLAAAEVDASEPSPLFWDHFAARVHRAILAEHDGSVSRLRRLGPAVGSSLGALIRWRAAVIVGVAVLVAGVSVSVLVDRPKPALSPLDPASVIVEAPIEAAPAVDDPSLSLVADLAADLDWEAAGEAGLTTHVGVDDDSLSQLTSDERRELRRLLQGELSPSRRGA